MTAIESELRDQRDEAYEQIRQLKAQLKALLVTRAAVYPLLHLTKSERCLLVMLVRARGVCTNAELFDGWRFLRASENHEEPTPAVVDVIVCRLRKKLTPHGITIMTEWGTGYWMTDAMRARLAECEG